MTAEPAHMPPATPLLDTIRDHDSPDRQYDAAGLDAPRITDTVLKALRHNGTGVREARG
jgi:1-deoxy-D-xylulose-5-phosphate synthase